MEDTKSIQIADKGRAAVVTFQTPCLSDTETINQASSQIKQYIDSHHPMRMVFDFDHVKFFSSQVLGMILETRAKLQTYRGSVVISSINPQLHRVFRITNLDRIFDFFPDCQSAVQASPAL